MSLITRSTLSHVHHRGCAHSGGEGNDLAEMALEETAELVAELREVEPSIVKNIMPRDSADSLNVVLEVRAGTGGEEASLFASELFKMYEEFCRARGWRWELLTQSRTDIGGFTAAQANVSGGWVLPK